MRESEYLEGNEQLVEVLKKIPAFQSFATQSLEDLIQLTKLRTFCAGEKIIREGETERLMYMLISGSVSVSKDNKDLAQLRRVGDIFGEMSLLGEGPRSASVTANANTSCLLIDAEYLEKLDYEGGNSFHSAIYQMFAQILAYRLRSTTEKYTQERLENERLRKQLAALTVTVKE